MIDIHCHILPGLDDGAQTLRESLVLANAAVENGITHTVCTPHIHYGRYNNNAASISIVCNNLHNALIENGINLAISCAAEVRFDIEILSAIERDDIPFLGKWHGENILLLEFPHGDMPVGATVLTRKLLDYGIRPMIAHPERNKGLLERPEYLSPFIEQGCLLQLTAASVTGNFGPKSEMMALSLIEKGQATVVATDAHHIKRRPPLLKQAYNIVCERVGYDTAQQLMVNTPWEIVQSLFPNTS
ncbi:tyrosine-protein phosphatase [Zhongshania sp.]|uniref:tyrosine-protein phosphatase n=1 Tax=Zhongshania sp. TaxID=1971902 RepID=UPI0035668699